VGEDEVEIGKFGSPPLNEDVMGLLDVRDLVDQWTEREKE